MFDLGKELMAGLEEDLKDFIEENEDVGLEWEQAQAQITELDVQLKDQMYRLNALAAIETGLEEASLLTDASEKKAKLLALDKAVELLGVSNGTTRLTLGVEEDSSEEELAIGVDAGLEGIWESVKKAAEKVWDAIVAIFKGIYDIIAKVLKTIKSVFSRSIEKTEKAAENLEEAKKESSVEEDKVVSMFLESLTSGLSGKTDAVIAVAYTGIGGGNIKPATIKTCIDRLDKLRNAKDGLLDDLVSLAATDLAVGKALVKTHEGFKGKQVAAKVNAFNGVIFSFTPGQYDHEEATTDSIVRYDSPSVWLKGEQIRLSVTTKVNAEDREAHIGTAIDVVNKKTATVEDVVKEEDFNSIDDIIALMNSSNGSWKTGIEHLDELTAGLTDVQEETKKVLRAIEDIRKTVKKSSEANRAFVKTINTLLAPALRTDAKAIGEIVKRFNQVSMGFVAANDVIVASVDSALEEAKA